MEGRSLILEITESNWRNWIEFLLVILPFTEEMKSLVLRRVGEEDGGYSHVQQEGLRGQEYLL